MSDHAARESGRPQPRRPSELTVRIVSGVSMLLIALVGIVLGGWAAAIVVGIVTAIVHLEWANLIDKSPWPSGVFTAGLVIALAMFTIGFTEGGFIIIGLAIVGSLLTGSLWRAIGTAYAATLGASLLLLRLDPEGFAAVFLLVAIVAASDTSAYFTGRAVGGPRLWPAVSPGKTWSGAGGGLVAGILAGLLVCWFTMTPVTPILVLVITALSVASQAGDLFESWVKRRARVKDSGRLIPGHGGLMDRVDGLVFAAGLAAAIGWLHGPNLARGLLSW